VQQLRVAAAAVFSLGLMIGLVLDIGRVAGREAWTAPAEAGQSTAAFPSIQPTVSGPPAAETAPRSALVLGQPKLSASLFNPATDSLRLTASINRQADASASIVPAAGGPAVRSLAARSSDSEVQLGWDGHDDKGQPVAAGAYRVKLEAHDGHGGSAEIFSEPVTVTNKGIVVSLSRQTLTAYEATNVVLRTPITSGGPELPTPAGTFHVLEKDSPLTMYSPWPQGSPYWFPDSTAHYAILFDETPDYGFYIHDAWWRTNYGPGSNAVAGTPGLNDTGTHGCINVPEDAEAALYAWAEVGIPVVVKD